ncbi:CheB methylesterase domain-containing protein [Antarctobacter jejuensis]|uniref:CheB methylesterase domain-containing protein n=1 Tax=Antarctobacter jejuensis TaxID=1439938 RepID=UPI003FD5E405
MNRKSIVIASPDRAQRNRLRDLVNRMEEFEVIACTGDLMNTYNEVEERLPKAVLIADILADLPEFEVMRALFATLDIRWLVMTDANRKGRFGSPPDGLASRSTDLFSIADDASEATFFQQLCALTRRDRHLSPAIRKDLATHKNGLPSRSVKTGSVDSQNSGQTTRFDKSLSEGLVSGSRFTPPQPRVVDHASRRPKTAAPYDHVILIGASTGGVDALLNVLTQFPEDCPPTLVVQHTGAGFGESLAALLDRQCLPKVQLATDLQPLCPGLVLIGAGVPSHLVLGTRASLDAKLVQGSPATGHLPSVDMLFRSAVPIADRVTAAILTGMGRDGAEGMKALYTAGAHTIAQNEASCVVYGMPRAAVEIGAVREVLPLERIAEALLKKRARPRKTGKEMQR